MVVPGGRNCQLIYQYSYLAHGGWDLGRVNCRSVMLTLGENEGRHEGRINEFDNIFQNGNIFSFLSFFLLICPVGQRTTTALTLDRDKLEWRHG
jgi:hypothetical protein